MAVVITLPVSNVALRPLYGRAIRSPAPFIMRVDLVPGAEEFNITLYDPASGQYLASVGTFRPAGGEFVEASFDPAYQVVANFPLPDQGLAGFSASTLHPEISNALAGIGPEFAPEDQPRYLNSLRASGVSVEESRPGAAYQNQTIPPQVASLRIPRVGDVPASVVATQAPYDRSAAAATAAMQPQPGRRPRLQPQDVQALDEKCAEVAEGLRGSQNLADLYAMAGNIGIWLPKNLLKADACRLISEFLVANDLLPEQGLMSPTPRAQTKRGGAGVVSPPLGGGKRQRY